MATEPAIGTRIKRARERKRWSQQRLADELHVNRKTVDNWENGRTEPKSSIGALEEVLGVSLDSAPEEPKTATPEELEKLRDHIREVLGEESDLEAALDARISGKPSSRNAGGAGGRPSRRAG
jgi:transcriptional regulator with XRE-family HTH domain